MDTFSIAKNRLAVVVLEPQSIYTHVHVIIISSQISAEMKVAFGIWMLANLKQMNVQIYQNISLLICDNVFVVKLTHHFNYYRCLYNNLCVLLIVLQFTRLECQYYEARNFSAAILISLKIACVQLNIHFSPTTNAILFCNTCNNNN